MTSASAISASATDSGVLPVIGDCIAVKAGYCGGKPHILGHRVKVQHIVVWHYRLGMSVEEIAATYPTLALGAVHAALAYYHSHRDEIDGDIRADDLFLAELIAKSGPSKLQQKMAELHAKDDSFPSG